jgi:outer membrane lipoprotein SlyB
MKTAKIVIAAFLATAALMSGCANTGSQSQSQSSSPAYYGADYGVIESIEMARSSNDRIGAGTVIGGVVGGVLGHQVGGGSGKDVATVAGVVGGAMVGHEMEKNNSQQDAYRIRVQLENGQYQTVTQQSVTGLRVGDHVRIENGSISRE